MKTTFLTTASLVLATICTGTARADHQFEHVDQLANRLRNQASRTAWEIRNNFRSSPEYQHLYRDAYEMYATANHIHEILHQGADLGHVQADVRTLDRLFHHLEELVRNVRPANDFHFPGHFGHEHFGSWHGPAGPSRSDLRRLRGLLAEMEDTLHHLGNDLQAVSGPAPPVSPIVRPVPYEVRIGSGRLGVSVRLP